jgi:hypothetical protein
MVRISFTPVDWGHTSLEDFLFEANDHYRERNGEDLNSEQLEWMQLIYEEYANDTGEVDWTHSMDNEAWYYYMSEVLGLDDETIERYTQD